MSRRGGGASPLILYYFQNSDYKYLLENVNVFAFKHIVIHNLLFVLFCFFPRVWPLSRGSLNVFLEYISLCLMLIHHATLLGLQMEYITAGCSHKPSLMSQIPIKHMDVPHVLVTVKITLKQVKEIAQSTLNIHRLKN